MSASLVDVADHALIAIMALLPLGEAWSYWPRIMRALADGVPGTRRRAYRNLIVLAWVLTAAVVALWVAQHRAWAALHVGPGRPLPTALGAAFVAGYLVLMMVQVRALVANPERLVRFAARQAKLDPLAPRTPDDQRLFVVLSVTTGSLWPAIVLHMGMDLIGGAIGRRAFRAAEQHAATGAPPRA